MIRKFNQAYKGKRVLITGSTGFKGSWLSVWLKMLGAEVAGLSNDIPTNPSNYLVSGLDKRIKEYWVDVRDYRPVFNAVKSFRPDIIFHLAAQALVRESLSEPRTTFNINVMGTVNILEAIRNYKESIPGVIITSDKCYRNREQDRGYVEGDELGGNDPYSASKGAAELVCRSYANIYNLRIATTRAGNVIGGGDWAQDRIVPDCVRSWSAGKVPLIRQSKATRPWQHVLESLSGYLWLGAKLFEDHGFKGKSYNFGPNAKDHLVIDLVKSFNKYWPEVEWQEDREGKQAIGECKLLKLNCEKAYSDLKWRTVLTFEEMIKMTAEWYLNYYQKKEDMYEFSVNQIEEYVEAAQKLKLPWAK
ncbi:MAG: CDP-glucose 4,6-dehydratase [Candidatus Staskawiczbacteria bacterium]|jgi:CDP-glucose 4,6-dehydratase